MFDFDEMTIHENIIKYWVSTYQTIHPFFHFFISKFMKEKINQGHCTRVLMGEENATEVYGKLIGNQE
jgi:hypothetical protein